MELPSFEALFGHAAEVKAAAPGRVNLIGDHTDYSGGWVLPMAIPQKTHVELARRSDTLVRAASAGAGSGAAQSYRIGEEQRGGGWLDYVQGVTHVLAKAGHTVGGFEVRLTSSVPLGAGLSSSAALELALLRALREAFALPLDDVALALLGQKVETEFVGAPVGVMDQMASSLADTGAALFLDTRTMHFERVPLPPDVEPVVIHSGITHSHAGGDYRTRRAECEEAARRLGVEQLRDVTEADLPRIAALPDPLFRRARHVVTENARVLAAVAAMRAGDGEALGVLMDSSHASLRDDFAVSVPDVDLLVAQARTHADVIGARMTGGGFGGAVVLLARRGKGALAGRWAADRYAEASGKTPELLVPPPR